MATSWSGVPGRRPALRIGHEERDTCVAGLADAYASGRITPDEYDERTSRIWAARTTDDVRPLFADLPGGSPLERRSPGAVAWAVRSRESSDRSGGPGRPFFGLVPLLVVLGVLTALTHLPWILLGLAAWFFLTRGRGRWHGRASGWDDRRVR